MAETVWTARAGAGGVSEGEQEEKEEKAGGGQKRREEGREEEEEWGREHRPGIPGEKLKN